MDPGLLFRLWWRVRGLSTHEGAQTFSDEPKGNGHTSGTIRARSPLENVLFFLLEASARHRGPAFGRLFNSRNYFAGGYRTGGVRDTQRPPWRSLALFTACIAPCVAESHVTPTTHGHSTIDTRPRFILSSSPVAYGIPFFSPSQKSQ